METEVATITWAERMKRLRQILDVSGPKFAEATGISVPNIRSIENGMTKLPTGDVMARIHKAYGVSLKWLLFGEGPVFEEPSKVEREVNQMRAELDKTRQQVEEWKAEAGYQETINRQLVALGKAKPAPKMTRLGKGSDVVRSPFQPRQLRHFFQPQATLGATS